MRSYLSVFSEPERSSRHPRRAIGQTAFRQNPSRSNGQARTEVLERRVAVLSYPSRGGFVALEDASGVDFEFLGLDPTNPPERRFLDQDAEDAFARRLLLLGAKWWTSNDRFALFQQTYPNLISGLPSGTTEAGIKSLTERERRLTI